MIEVLSHSSMKSKNKSIGKQSVECLGLKRKLIIDGGSPDKKKKVKIEGIEEHRMDYDKVG